MITTRFYHDCRNAKAGAVAPIKLVITRRSVRATMPTSVAVTREQWSVERQCVVGHTQKRTLNAILQAKKVEVDEVIARLLRLGALNGLVAGQVRDAVLAELEAGEPAAPVRRGVYDCFVDFMATKKGRTQQLYDTTLRSLMKFCPEFRTMSFEQVNVSWLERWDLFMSQTAPSRNSRNINMRNLRAVFNRAIDDGETVSYPFRRYKLRPEPTQKRSMSVEQIRKVVHTPMPKDLEQYRDMFVLMFCLRGINVIDLCGLQRIDSDGRVRFSRSKTKRPYAILVEPEARAIIERYRGKGQLLRMMDGRKHYRSWYQQLARGLKRVKAVLNGVRDGVVVDELTSYWARHTWATAAGWLDIPKETIVAGLGHGMNTVTDIYIDFDMRKVDVANRRVLDLVFCDGE